MPLLIMILLGAVVLWLVSSVFFEKIGGVVLKFYKKFKNNISYNDGEEKKNE